MPIRCREIFNHYCLRCKSIDLRMARVGVMDFCVECWMDIFGGQENFDADSYYGKQYYKWLNIYKKDVESS